jgi:hypothetical protein
VTEELRFNDTEPRAAIADAERREAEAQTARLLGMTLDEAHARLHQLRSDDAA